MTASSSLPQISNGSQEFGLNMLDVDFTATFDNIPSGQ